MHIRILIQAGNLPIWAMLRKPAHRAAGSAADVDDAKRRCGICRLRLCRSRLRYLNSRKLEHLPRQRKSSRSAETALICIHFLHLSFLCFYLSASFHRGQVVCTERNLLPILIHMKAALAQALDIKVPGILKRHGCDRESVAFCTL